jgi:hypothetical protein
VLKGGGRQEEGIDWEGSFTNPWQVRTLGCGVKMLLSSLEGLGSSGFPALFSQQLLQTEASA